jgi:hypothetical protein
VTMYGFVSAMIAFGIFMTLMACWVARR